MKRIEFALDQTLDGLQLTARGLGQLGRHLPFHVTTVPAFHEL